MRGCRLGDGAKGGHQEGQPNFHGEVLVVDCPPLPFPHSPDNIVTWDREVLMAAMIDGFKVDFAWLLQAVMHERAFKVTTTYPFPCMIFSLCRSAGVPIWHVDQLKTPLSTVDVGLIRDEANELAPHRGPHLELPPLSDDLADTVAHARMAMQDASETIHYPG